MTKSQQLIDAVAANPGLTADELAEKCGTNKSRTGALLSFVKGQRRVVGRRTKGERAMRYYPAGGGVHKTRRRKSKKPRAATPRTIKEVARKHLNGNGASLAQRHVGTTLAALEAVIDLDDAEPMLAAAFKSHQEAVELALG